MKNLIAFSKMTLVLSLTLLIAACDNGMKSSSSGGGGNAAQAAGIEGDWGQDACIPGAPGKLDYTYVMSFTGNRMISTYHHYYKDQAYPCSELGYVQVVEWTVSTSASPYGTGVSNINLAMTRNTVTALDPDMAAEFNDDAKYGYYNWIVNQPVSFTSFDPYYFQAFAYDLVLVSNGELFWGERTSTYDTTTPERRPVRIDFENPDYRL